MIVNAAQMHGGRLYIGFKEKVTVTEAEVRWESGTGIIYFESVYHISKNHQCE